MVMAIKSDHPTKFHNVRKLFQDLFPPFPSFCFLPNRSLHRRKYKNPKIFFRSKSLRGLLFHFSLVLLSPLIPGCQVSSLPYTGAVGCVSAVRRCKRIVHTSCRAIPTQHVVVYLRDNTTSGGCSVTMRAQCHSWVPDTERRE